jgi:alginate O-acetyltransferase complex protein AlgI
MSYVVEVYRGRQEPVRNPIDYALFISFFPQLVAGPIVRAREFFADFYNWRAPSGEEILRGTLMVIFGLAKKMVLADQFARIADMYFKQPSAHPGMLAAWSGVLAFSMQIYFDFSGYTDMAIGMAQILGFHFPMNFRRPYLADSMTEFWRRWHMSLSRWLRDYLYIPLGGNRHGRLQTYRNLMLTMLLGGLWHGASWNFVVWGGYHGVLLSLERVTDLPGRKTPLLTPLRIAITFTLASLGWVFFRAADLPTSGYIIGQMFAGGASHMLWYGWQLWLIFSILVLTVLQEKLDWFERLITAPAWVYATVVASLLLSVELIGVSDVAVPFVYFQF